MYPKALVSVILKESCWVIGLRLLTFLPLVFVILLMKYFCECCESRNSHIFYRLSSACIHDAVFQCVCFQNQCVWVDSARICIYVYPCTVYFSFLDCYHDRRALFPLSHQHQRCPFVSITHHFLSVLIQTHGSQLCLIACKLHSTHMAVTVYVPGKSRWRLSHRSH